MSTRVSDNARGFTLVELLVGLAIFTTIMAGVTLMFNSAVRTTKQGYLNQRAFENVRGAFSIIEEDLTRSFSGRTTGHKHTFYGTPFGFTFVGLVPAEGESRFNTARISYVVYGAEDTESNLTKRYATAASDEDASFELNTYSLIRIVENSQDDLDSYPVNWAAATVGAEGKTLGTYLLEAAVQASANLVCADPVALDGSATNPIAELTQIQGYDCLERVVNSKKTELWLRMLSGDPNLPDYWGDTTGTVRIGSLNGSLIVPEDFIVAENLMFIERHQDPGDASVTPFDPENPDLQVGYTVLTSEPFNDFPPFIDGAGQDVAIIEFDSIAADSTTRWAAFADYTVAQGLLTAPYSPMTFFFAYREYDAEVGRQDDFGNDIYAVDAVGNLLDGSGALPTIPSNEVAPRHFAFWNDTRNLAWNRFLNDDFVIDNLALPPVNQVILTTNERSTVPDIIDPALPESILLEFAVFYPTPYPGAPDFERVFSHRVNLPSAYRRKAESQLTKAVRDAEGR